MKRQTRYAIAAMLLLQPGLSLAEYRWTAGDFEAQLNSTLTMGIAFRAEDRDPLLFSRGNGGEGLSSNFDDGNLNYDKGDITYAPIYYNGDLSLRWRNNSGAFIRTLVYYDPVNVDFDEADVVGQKRTSDIKDEIGQDIDLLDAYVYYNGEVFERPYTFRLGRQVLSWGESTFIQFGVNSINTFDLNKLNLPGLELKNVFLPENLAFLQMELSENLGIELYYKLDHQEIVLEPRGSFFGQTDGQSIGGDFFALESKRFSQNELPNGYKTFRRPDLKAPKSGQYGIGFSWFLPALDAEVGFFYQNIHSHLPVTSGFSLSQAEWEQLNEITVGQTGTGLQDPTGVTGLLLVAGLLNPDSINDDQIAKLDSIERGLGGYRLEYLEDIQIFGVSFNASMPFGIALQGELSYRKDQPFQIDEYELVYYALDPIRQLAGPVGGTVYGTIITPNQIGTNNQPGSYFPGYRRMDMAQLQFTASYLVGPRNPFGASQWVIAGEVGATQVIDMPDRSELRFEAPGTNAKGGTADAVEEYYADDFGWGMRFITFLAYPNLFGTSWSMNPVATFGWDPKGTPAGPARNFIEDRMSASLSLKFGYLQRWQFELNYQAFFGRGDDYRITNQLQDRDNYAVGVKYLF